VIDSQFEYVIDRDGNEINVAHYVKGNVTPVEAYRLAYEHRNKLLVFDDAERLWPTPTGDSCSAI